MGEYAEQIAKAALDIGAITLSPKEPYKWASGYFMPIYNDNRKHLAYPENRKLITSAFMNIIEREGIKPEIITGTMTAGIAPAASLAQELELPLAIIQELKVPSSVMQNGKMNNIALYVFTPDLVNRIVEDASFKSADIVVSTCPSSIVPGVFTANNHQLPFAYVRSKGKDHGLKQQIEGIVKEGQKAVFYDFRTSTESYMANAVAALAEKGVVLQEAFFNDILDYVIESHDFVKGKKILHIEDLVSTGGSCVEEIQTLRQMGAQISDCLAIFSYDFPETLHKFRTAACRLHPALTYDQLLDVALEQKAIESENLEMLKEWRKAPFEWGKKHGKLREAR